MLFGEYVTTIWWSAWKPAQQRLRFHDLRHTHAVWLLARQVPIGAIARRLGHANPVVTMRMYLHAATRVHQGQLTTRQLGLTTRWPRRKPG
jgi:integrase